MKYEPRKSPLPSEALRLAHQKQKPATKPKPAPEPQSELADFMAQYLPQAGEPVSDDRGGRKWVLDSCPFNPKHHDSAIFEAPNGTPGFHCFSCPGTAR